MTQEEAIYESLPKTELIVGELSGIILSARVFVCPASAPDESTIVEIGTRPHGFALSMELESGRLVLNGLISALKNWGTAHRDRENYVVVKNGRLVIYEDYTECEISVTSNFAEWRNGRDLGDCVFITGLGLSFAWEARHLPRLIRSLRRALDKVK